MKSGPDLWDKIDQRDALQSVIAIISDNFPVTACQEEQQAADQNSQRSAQIRLHHNETERMRSYPME